MAQSSNILESKAEKHMQAGRFSEAVKKYTKLLEEVPDESFRWLCSRGEAYLKLGDATNALEDGKKAKEINNSIKACIICGKAAVIQGQFTDALNFFKEGLKVDAHNAIIIEELKKLQTIILKDHQSKTSEDSTYSAVTLCSQSIYPGDDELLRMEKQILEVKYKILQDDAYKDGVGASKDSQMEARLVQAAYECLTSQRLDESLTLISKAVAMDPKNVFYRTFRAQVYFNMKQWEKVIQDYWVIPKSQRKVDVWKQGGKALMELWLPVLAEFWFRKATQLSLGKDEEASTLFQKVRVKRLYDPLTEDQPVVVDFCQFGRAVYAKRNITKGENVMIDIPMVIAQSLTSKDIPACCNCATSLLTPEIYFKNNLKKMGKDQLELIEQFWPDVSQVLCPHCSREIYCSEICQKEAWDVYHKILCPSQNPAAGKLYDLCQKEGYGYTEDGKWKELWGGHYSPMILAKIWAIIASQVLKMMESDGLATPTVEHWARAKAPFRRFIAFGTTPAVQQMPYMLPVFQSVFANCGGGISYDITVEEFNGRYYQAACNLQCFSPSITPYHRFMNNLKDNIRGIGLIQYLTSDPPEAQFAAMCPLHACCNHSCLNNAEVCDIDINGRPGIQMIACKDIKEGDEIFITYIDTSMPKLLRKAWLFKSFNFWCQCQRCQFEGEQPNECTNCSKKAPDGSKFAGCGKCKAAWYCSKTCQKMHWKKGHKVVCLTEHSKAKETAEFPP